MSSSPLRESIEFMMRCRRGFNPDTVLHELRQQVLTQAQESIDNLATTILAQQTTADTQLGVQMESMCALNSFEESLAALEEIRTALLQERDDQEKQDAAITKGEKTIVASKAAYKNLETNLRRHLEAISKKTVGSA